MGEAKTPIRDVYCCEECRKADFNRARLWDSQCPIHEVPEADFKRAAKLAVTTVFTERQIAEPFGSLARFVLRSGGTLDQAQRAISELARAATVCVVRPADLVDDLMSIGRQTSTYGISRLPWRW